jgi:hypothetical protein
MRFTKIHFALPVLGALLAFTATSHAASVSGSVWEGATSYPSSLSPTAPSGTPTATFTVSGVGDLFNFVSGGSNDLTADPTYTLGGYLTSGGDSVAYATGSGSAGDSINNDVFQFTGTTYLAAGTTYGITHDDGMYLFLAPVSSPTSFTEAINSGSPTSADLSNFSVGTSGYYDFNLLYAEVNGAPAVLSGTLGNLSPTPEPSSLMLLGTGLAGLAGVVRRKLTA